MKKAIRDLLLLSGGLDSTLVAHWWKPEAAIFVDYGQVAAQSELKAFHHVCDKLEIKKHTLSVDISQYGFGAMFGGEGAVIGYDRDWLPFRNQYLITCAGMCAAKFGYHRLLVGSLKSDNIYGDGSQDFFKKINDTMMCQEGDIQVMAPAINLNAEELFELSGALADDIGVCHSCNNSTIGCGRCASCQKLHDVLGLAGFFN